MSMKKHLWIVLICLTVAVVTTGCSLAGGETKKEVLNPLKAADWPTPLPATPPPSPTPFPKITLVPTATPTAQPTSVVTSTPLSLGGVSYSGNVEDLTKQVTALSGGLSPVAAAMVVGDKVDVRQGPGTSYPSLGVAEPATLAAVLGKNPAGDWLYVLTISQLQGWLPTASLRVTGAMEKAPVLPPNPLAALAPKATPASPAGAATGGAGGTGPATTGTGPTQEAQPVALDSLTPATTARVNNDSMNMRQGPGAAYALLGTLSRGDQVSVLALNMTKDWALVKTAKGQFGWASLSFLAVDGSLAAVPQVRSPAPGGDFPADQVAPIFPAEAATGAVAPANTGSAPAGSAAQPQAAPVSQAGPAVFGGDLTPVATAHVKVGGTHLYKGPATTYAPLDKLAVDEPLAVLALNGQRDWALVKPLNHSPAWGPLNDLEVAGSLANAPSIVTAWVVSNDLKLRAGPGIYFGESGRLAINDLVDVLGVNAGRSWALVRPVLGGGTGWIGVDFLQLGGAWEAMPQAPEPPVAEQATTAAQVPAPTGPPQGKLVLGLESGGDIMVVNADGSGLRRLTSGIDPALSPDGQTVAYTRWTGRDGTLWLINVDGSNERAVLGETTQAKHPAWSPDGKKIVINFQHGGRIDDKEACVNLQSLKGQPDIPFNVNPDTIEMKLKNFKPYLCWLSPADPHWGLRTVNVADGSFADMPSDTYAFGPEWDPANAWRVVSSGINGLVQLDVNQMQQRALTDRREDHTPAFSPDGRYLAVAFSQNNIYDIFRLNGDGSGRVRLTDTPLWVTAGPGEHKAWNNVSPTWSPDGSRIAFLTDRSGDWQIWLMNADGSDPHPMFSDAVNKQLQITYNFVDERVLSWR
jgi:TolB protein